MHPNGMRHSLFFILLILLLAGNVSLISAQISNPEGELHSPMEDDIWAKTLSGSHYNEFWNYQFYLDNGSTVHVAFSVANFGTFKSPVSGVQLSIFNLDGNLYQVSREYPIHYLVQDRDEFMFQLRNERDIYFKGKLPDEHRVKVRFSKDGRQYDVDLKLDNIHPGIVWGDGLYHIGNEDVGVITHIPYADVSGYIMVDDIRREVTGTGYMDHTYQQESTTRLVHSGYRFVYQKDRNNWDVINFLLPEDDRFKETVGHRIRKIDGKFQVAGIETIDKLYETEVFGHKIARILELSLENDQKVRLTRTVDNQEFSVLGELGWLAKRAAKSFLGGEVVNVRGEAVLMETGNRPKSGFYNFFKIE